jgi:hypothetical protein
MATKPIIAGAELEWDVRSITALNPIDHSTVATWPDTSGAANPGSGFDNTRRVELEGWNGTRPSVHYEDALQDNHNTQHVQVPFTNSLWTVFVVVEPIDISNHLGIYGSDSGASPNNRTIHLFALSDGSLVLHRSNETPYMIQTAPGTIVEGTKYIITAQYAGGVIGTKLRLNGVQVGILNTGIGLQSQLDYSSPGFGVIFDQSTGGVGRIFGMKRFAWASGYSSAPSDATMLDFEKFLADRFNVPGVAKATTKPAIPGHEFEYDVIPLVLNQSDLVSPWPDTSPVGTGAVLGGGNPEYESGSWQDAQECVRLFQPAFGGSFNFDGTPFVGTDMTWFIVFRCFELPNLAFIGGSSFADRGQVEFFVKPDGSVAFSFATGEGAAFIVVSPAGAVAADGTCHVLTARHSSISGKIIRLDGVEIGANPSSTGNLTQFPTARVGNIANIVGIADSRFTWVAGYSTAAALAEMEQMEQFLDELWCAAPVLVSPWVPSQEPLGSAWIPSNEPGGSVWVDPNAPAGAASGVPSLKNGIVVGFTDFSEFSVAAGLPSGITEFGDGVNSPATVAIANDAQEGNYFSMDDHNLFESWAFGLDSFFGLIEFGEMLARVFYNPDQDNRRTVGPSFSMEGATDVTLRMASGSVSRPGDDIPQLDGVISIDGTSFVPHNANDIQEAGQIGSWMWLRIRRTQNSGTPANDDWQSTGWYGDIGDEPVAIDGSSLNQSQTQRGLEALGWSGVEFTSVNEQRIAFLSFSADPLLAAPPIPGEVPTPPSTDWSPS